MCQYLKLLGAKKGHATESKCDIEESIFSRERCDFYYQHMSVCDV